MSALEESPGWVAPPRAVGPAPGLRYGGFWIRVLACVIDIVILVAVMRLLTSVVGIEFWEVQVQDSTFNGFSNRSFVVVLNPLALLASLTYFAGQWWIRGRTIGMALLGLRVVRGADGTAIGPGRGIGRFFGLVLSFLVLAIGVIWVAADARKQGWHDKLAGTVVVRPSTDVISVPSTGGPV